ncbi:MAG: hypothetical protein QNK37_28855 [Acidobacteriota bacterium]|nr:hypothetical protein [Acidobacteriota bacterium]
MTKPCNRYEQYELGSLGEADYRAHAADCPQCQALEARDRELLDLCAELRDEPVDIDTPWQKLKPKLTARRAPLIAFPKRSRIAMVAAAAALILAFVLGWQMGRTDQEAVPGLLSDSLLAEVADRESQYLAAIERLAVAAQAPLNRMDDELRRLYQSRLAVIDAQIEECKDELTRNPANAHIRRYLLAALQDKSATLNEIIDYPQLPI